MPSRFPRSRQALTHWAISPGRWAIGDVLGSLQIGGKGAARGALRVLCEASRQGGFRAAAAQLREATASVSEAVQRFEDRLGVRLFERSSGSVRLTPIGEAFYAKSLPAIVELEAALRDLDDQKHEVTGVLRLSAPYSAGPFFLDALVARFAEAYPAVDVELIFDDRKVDLLTSGIDAAIRSSPLLGPDTHAVAVGPELAMAVVASTEYLARRGRPAHPRDILGHDALCYAIGRGGRIPLARDCGAGLCLGGGCDELRDRRALRSAPDASVPATSQAAARLAQGQDRAGHAWRGLCRGGAVSRPGGLGHPVSGGQSEHAMADVSAGLWPWGGPGCRAVSDLRGARRAGSGPCAALHGGSPGGHPAWPLHPALRALYLATERAVLCGEMPAGHGAGGLGLSRLQPSLLFRAEQPCGPAPAA